MAYTTIDKSSLHFNAKKYSGTGSAQSITGVGFQPDWCWIKNASSGSNYSHQLYDAIRGVTKYLQSNSTASETTQAEGLTAFGTDGFSVGTNNGANSNGSTLISWNWKAGGSGSSNSDGSISSTVSANTTAGFSIVKWTGTASAGTIGHGLGVAPKVVLVKRYSTSGGGWLMQHSNLTGATYVIKLSGATAEENDGANFNSTFPTSSVFSVYNSNNTNASGADHIAYCFAEKKGFSKFGSYVGDSSNYPFVNLSFKPAFIMIKSVSTTNWNIFDNKRETFNQVDYPIWANDSAKEQTDPYPIDMVSNGFTVRTNSSQVNNNNTVHIYMAFAEAPLVGSNDVPCTAR